jgi:hypothetical protein
LLTSGLVLAVCGLIAILSSVSYGSARGQLNGLTARGHGLITATGPDDSVTVQWNPPGEVVRTLVLPLAITPPATGTPTEVAYDPARPDRAVVPGAAVLANADRAASGLAFATLLAALVLAIGLWRLLSRSRLRRRPAEPVLVRRVRVQRGLITRSWLETESGPQRWIPVYFDPILVTLPAPATVHLRGDVRRNHLVAADVDSTLLYPSGRVRDTEPRGRRIDNPTAPDAATTGRAMLASTMRRQLRVDAAALVPAPFVGLLWSYLDSTSVTGFLGATAVCGALGLWLWWLRGSDPS